MKALGKLIQLDVGLLVALDTLLTEKSVSRAAIRMNMSQPTMSHALSRLRAILSDPVLIRSQNEMVPTLRAAKMHSAVRQLLASIEMTFSEFKSFDPEHDESVVTITTVDYVDLLILPKVLAEMRRAAPRVRVLGRPVLTAIDLHDDLVSGHSDLGIAFSSNIPLGLRTISIGMDEYVCIGSKKLWGNIDLDYDAYLSAQHLVVSPGGNFGATAVDQALALQNSQRSIVYSAPHFANAAATVEATDLLATVHRGIAEKMQILYEIVIHPLPFEVPKLRLSLIWHERTHENPLMKWLRKIIQDVARRDGCLTHDVSDTPQS